MLTWSGGTSVGEKNVGEPIQLENGSDMKTTIECQFSFKTGRKKKLFAKCVNYTTFLSLIYQKVLPYDKYNHLSSIIEKSWLFSN